MRTKLKKLNEERLTFIGIFDRHGTKNNYMGFPEKTILLKNITTQTKAGATYYYLKRLLKVPDLKKTHLPFR